MFKAWNFEVSTFVAVMKPDLPLSGVTSRVDLCWRSDGEGWWWWYLKYKKKPKDVKVMVLQQKQETN